MQYIDFHTHILHEIDDGAQSLEEAIEMLKAAHQCGAETVVLTPHFQSSKMNIAEFCAKRDKKVKELKSAMKKDGGAFPKILVGAEVLLDDIISEREDVSRLCIEGTDILMLELPYITWGPWHTQEIRELISRCNLTPIIAHIERYFRNPNEILPKLDGFVSLGAKFQINATSFLSFGGRRIIRVLAAEGMIAAIGSDCHNAKDRSPDISRALSKLAKKFDEGFIHYLYSKSRQLLSDSKTQNDNG